MLCDKFLRYLLPYHNQSLEWTDRRAGHSDLTGLRLQQEQHSSEYSLVHANVRDRLKNRRGII